MDMNKLQTGTKIRLKNDVTSEGEMLARAGTVCEIVREPRRSAAREYASSSRQPIYGVLIQLPALDDSWSWQIDVRVDRVELI